MNCRHSIRDIAALLVRQFDVRSTARMLSTVSPYAIFAIVVMLGQSPCCRGGGL
jgi:hypothetical protein